MAAATQLQAGRILDPQRQPVHALAIEPSHQIERVAIGPQQQVLAVVQRDAVGIGPGQHLPAGPPASLGRGLQHADRYAGLPQVQRCRQARPAGPDDDDRVHRPRRRGMPGVPVGKHVSHDVRG